MAAIRSVGTGANLRIRREQTHGHVGETGARSRSAARTSIVELEAAILIVGAARNAVHVDLIEVVLAGTLKLSTKFECMVVLDPGQVVRHGVDRARGAGGVRTAVDLPDVRDNDGRYLVED